MSDNDPFSLYETTAVRGGKINVKITALAPGESARHGFRTHYFASSAFSLLNHVPATQTSFQPKMEQLGTYS